jgi:predicted transcriptional regulator
MKFSRHQAIREALLESEDGMTLSQLAERFDCSTKTLGKTIKNIYGVYIDRWTVPKRGQFAAVYMCVETPSHAPHPTERYIPTTMWQPTEQRT